MSQQPSSDTAFSVQQALVTMADNIATEAAWIMPLRVALEGVEATEAAWKPAPDESSLWEIVEHILAWTEWAVHFLQGQDSDVTDWPPVAITEERAWEAARRKLFVALDALRAQIASADPETLFLPLTPEVTQTTGFVGIASILVHNAYHAGQIAKLRAWYERAGV